jgi:7 transmembrane sweet-taste receptor of 3 GCPR
MSYIGMQGEKNRQKLADTFLRPTTWKHYCDQVSQDNCTTATKAAQRPPRNEEEGRKYFATNLYTGHFRKTEENIGTATTPATGHVVDFPCEWASYVEQQMFHLDIALSGDKHQEGKRGYTSRELPQIIQAANATKSDIILQWSMPDPWHQRFIGTDMELYPIILPPLTQTCLEHKRNWSDICSANYSARVGDPLGACEEPPMSLRKVMSTSLSRSTDDPSISDADRSPTVAALKLFTNSLPLYGSWFDLVIERDGLADGRAAAMRDATCQWVVDNFDTFQSFVPYSYPRVIVDRQENSALTMSALVLGALAIALVLAAFAVVYQFRNRRVMVVAQVDFLWFLLTGMLIMSTGALVAAIPPTDGSCVATVWLVFVGYTVELAPLLVKVAAVNRLMSASQKLAKVKISRKSLFRSVLGVSFVLVVFLAFWTVRDPPGKQWELSLSESMTVDGETIVHRIYYCSSESDIWEYAAFIWTGALLFSATVLAFQMRNVRQEFNESQTLGIMTYSHFVFLTLRLVTFLLTSQLGESNSSLYRSILLSLDAIASLVIYFLPKFIVLRNMDATAAIISSRSMRDCTVSQCQSPQDGSGFNGDFGMGGTPKLPGYGHSSDCGSSGSEMVRFPSDDHHLANPKNIGAENSNQKQLKHSQQAGNGAPLCDGNDDLKIHRRPSHQPEGTVDTLSSLEGFDGDPS